MSGDIGSTGQDSPLTNLDQFSQHLINGSPRDKDIVRLIKVAGAKNPADFCTKILPVTEFRKQLKPKKKIKSDGRGCTIGEGVEDDKFRYVCAQQCD